MTTRLAAILFAAALFASCLLAAPLPARAAGTMDNPETVEYDSDFAAGKRALDAGNWEAAIRSLGLAQARHPRDADIQNLLGYANRKLGKLDLAFKYYDRALELNPKHRGALEYEGVAYLLVNNLPKAEEHLAALKKICFLPCEEYNDLKKAIVDYRQGNEKLPSGY
jgi:Flp pilus assembly protein TadD